MCQTNDSGFLGRILQIYQACNSWWAGADRHHAISFIYSPKLYEKKKIHINLMKWYVCKYNTYIMDDTHFLAGLECAM